MLSSSRTCRTAWERVRGMLCSAEMVEHHAVTLTASRHVVSLGGDRTPVPQIAFSLGLDPKRTPAHSAAGAVVASGPRLGRYRRCRLRLRCRDWVGHAARPGPAVDLPS